MKVSPVDIAEIDAYLGADKALADGVPTWSVSFGNEHSARWGIVDSLGTQSGELVFKCRANLMWPSILLLRRGFLIHRTDLVPASEQKPNPLSAFALGLPAVVTGSHMHRWQDNRDHVERAGYGQLPNRWPTPTALRTFEQAFAATCHELNIHLEPSQRAFDLPEQGDLF